MKQKHSVCSRARLLGTGMFALALAVAFTLAGASSAEAAKTKYKGTNHAKAKGTPTYRVSKSGGIITHKTRAQRAKPSGR